MEEGRGTVSSQGSTQATSSMRPPQPQPQAPAAGGSSVAGLAVGSSSRHSSHVWNYFSREPTDNPTRFLAHCLICIANNRHQPPFTHAKGTGTGTLDRHLQSKHNITKQSHESGAARGEGPVQAQIGGFMTSSPGGGMPFCYGP